MCGIVGMLLRHGEVARWEPEIIRSTDLMMRRGPDRAGMWSSPSGCVLGFRRLSILDLTEAGERLHRQCRDIFAADVRLPNTLETAGEDVTGHVSIQSLSPAHNPARDRHL